MRTVRIATAALVTGSAGLAFLPIAQAAETQEKLVPVQEAWFQPNPTCALPTGCLGTEALPAQPPAELPTSPYPAGTMHVAVDAGQETARSYLGFVLPTVDARLAAAKLEIPLDAAPESGGVTPEAAKVAVCTFTGSFQPASGSIATPPAAACGGKVTAKYVATPTPHLEADLAPLLEALATGAGIALLPDAATVTQTDAWHVAFSSHDRADAAKTAPASLTVTLIPVETSDPEPPPVITPPVVDTGSTVAPPLGPVTTTVEPPPVAPAPPVTGPAPAAPVVPVPQAQSITVGYAYPTIWLLPLAFLIGIPAVARALTRDLTPIPVAPVLPE